MRNCAYGPGRRDQLQICRCPNGGSLATITPISKTSCQAVDARLLQYNEAVFASVLWVALSPGAFAAGVEPAKDLLIDPAPCLPPAAANDNDRIYSASART